jgi:hypothetical protein
MTTIKAIVRDGRLEVDEPLDLPDGTVLQIPVPGDAERTADGPMSADEIRQVLAAMDRMQPLQMTDTELAAWEVDRQARKAQAKAHFHEQTENWAS